jgi:hypothetical protein
MRCKSHWPWLIGAAFCAAQAYAIDSGPYQITVQADVRLVAVDSPYDSFVHGGVGLLRFDEEHDGLQLGRFMANFNGPITDTLRADVTLSAVGDGNDNPIDFTEAFLEWRPYPIDQWRWRTRIGSFYAPISLENRAVGWQSPYSISSSAINTWIGEEVRTIGVEQSLTLQSAGTARNYELAAVVGAYVANDPMGILVFQRGWAIHDRQTGLASTLPRPISAAPDIEPIQFYREIDGRVGYYAGAEYRYGQSQVLRALHYDNRGNPAARSGKEPAWLSRFDSLGWRYEMPTDTTLIVQALKGDTSVGPSSDGRGALIGEYWSYFALASQQVGKHRFSTRYDRMYTESTRGAAFFNSEQTAIGWTFAYMWDMSNAWQFACELVEIRGSLQQRARRGLDPYGDERNIQLAIRYSL